MEEVKTPGRLVRAALALTLLASAAAAAAAAGPQVAPPTTPPGQGVHFVFLVRHGAYQRDDNADELLANPLNALGHEQARLVGARLADMPVRFRALVTSDFQRARQTADDIGAQLQMTPAVDTLIRECTPTTEHPEYATYHSPEDIAACVVQLQNAWTKYLVPTPDADTWDVLVTHGNVIRWLTLRSLGATQAHWYDPETANAALSVIEVRADGSMRLVTYNDTGHLAPEKQTWAGRGMGFAKR